MTAAAAAAAALPRVSLGAALAAALGAPWELAFSPSDVSLSIAAAADPLYAAPSEARDAAELLIEVQPLGTPDAPIAAGRAFALQPRLRLVDRHDRAVNATRLPLHCEASLAGGAEAAPAAAAAAAAPPPDSSASALLLGDTGQVLGGDGSIAFASLRVSANLSAAAIAFDVTWLGGAAAAAALPRLSASSRRFAVPLPPPVAVQPPAPRVPLSPILVGALCAAAIAAAIGAAWHALRARRRAIAARRIGDAGATANAAAEAAGVAAESAAATVAGRRCVVYDTRGAALAAGRMMELQRMIADGRIVPPRGAFFFAPAEAAGSEVEAMAAAAAAAAAEEAEAKVEAEAEAEAETEAAVTLARGSSAAQEAPCSGNDAGAATAAAAAASTDVAAAALDVAAKGVDVDDAVTGPMPAQAPPQQAPRPSCRRNF